MATPCPIERSIGCPMGWSIGTLGALERHESHVVEAVEFAKAPVVWCYEPAFMWWVPYTKMVSSWHKVREWLPTNMELSFQLLVKHKIWINTRNGTMLCYSNGDDSCQWYVWGTMKPWPFSGMISRESVRITVTCFPRCWDWMLRNNCGQFPWLKEGWIGQFHLWPRHFGWSKHGVANLSRIDLGGGVQNGVVA